MSSVVSEYISRLRLEDRGDLQERIVLEVFLGGDLPMCRLEFKNTRSGGRWNATLQLLCSMRLKKSQHHYCEAARTPDDRKADISWRSLPCLVAALRRLASQEVDVAFPAGRHHVGGPDAGLNLADVRLAQIEHAQPRLPDAATDGQRELAVQQTAVEKQFLAVFGARESQLPQERILVDPDAHGGKLESRFENGIVDEDVAIKSFETSLVGRRPVVVVGSAAVVSLAVFERGADADDEHGAVFLAHRVLTLLR